MKRFILIGCLALTTATSTSALADGGIPTLDINSVEQLNALLDQLETAQAQLRQTEAQLEALTQSSGFGYVIDNPQVRDAMRQALPTDVSALLNRLDSQNTPMSGSID